MGSPTRWLIDECLSPRLADKAASRSVEASHVTRRGLKGRPDPVIAQWCVANDHAFVTNNARDFRRIYGRLEVHPGLAIILPTVDGPVQAELFDVVLQRVAIEADLVNKLVEIDAAGAITIMDWPA